MKLVYPPFSTPMLDEDNKLIQPWMGWILVVYQILNSGYNGTIVTAKLTGGGTNGSMTFENGVLVSQVAPT